MDSLKDRLAADLKTALRGGDALKTSVLRLLLSAINYAEIARQKTLGDEDVLGVIAKEIKQRRESIEAFKQSRPELAEKESREMAILQAYQPQQLNREEVAALAKQAIATLGASGPGDKGRVMASLMPQLRGKADGKQASDIVSELLR